MLNRAILASFLVLIPMCVFAQSRENQSVPGIQVTLPHGPDYSDRTGLLTGLSGLNITGRPGSTLFVRPALNLGDGTMLASKSSNFAVDKGLELSGSTILLEPTSGGLKIVVPAGMPGITMNSTDALTAATPGLLTFNNFSNTVNAAITGSSDPFNSQGCQCVSNFGSSLSIGPNFTGVEAYGGSFGVVTYGNTKTLSDLVGVASGVSQSFTGLSRIYGANTGATLGVNGRSPVVLGHEVDVSVNSATGTPYRLGYNAANTGSDGGTVGDTAFSLMSGPATGQWKRAIGLTTLASQITGSINGVKLSVTSITAATGDQQVGGKPVIGSTIYGPGVARGTKVTAVNGSNPRTCSSGTPCTYTVSVPQMVASTSMQAASLNPALASTGSVFGSESPQTVATVLDLSNFDVTGQIIKAPGVMLNGNGNFITAGVSLYGTPAAVPVGQVGYGGVTVSDTSKCGSLPGAKGCIIINVGGTQAYLPYFY